MKFRDNIYCYSGTDTLVSLSEKHKFNTMYDRLVSDNKVIELNEKLESKSVKSIKPDIKEIHKKMFDSVYSWAGETRKVSIPIRLGKFCEPENIDKELKSINRDLKRNKYFKNFSQEKFVEQSSQMYKKLNFIHPFREGNGRVQRHFLKEVSHKAGFELDLNNLPKEEYLKAVKHEGNSVLKESFKKAIEVTRSKNPEILQLSKIGYTKQDYDNLNIDSFSKKASKLYLDLENNEFKDDIIKKVAKNAGYKLNLKKIDKANLDHAIIKKDVSGVKKMFDKVITPQQLKKQSKLEQLKARREREKGQGIER